MTEAILELMEISKAFAGVSAVRGVNLTLDKGRILGLIGQNGAGKSTLMNIIGGVIQPDAGAMRLAGLPYAPRNPAEATHNRIAFIHQELNLFTNLTIAENIFLGAFPKRHVGPAKFVDRTRLAEATRALLHQVNLDLDPDTSLDRLSPGERQLVEVARALRLDARIIIFDEPTTSLTQREIARLFALIDQLRKLDKSLIYISHILADVFALSDDVAVMRDGELVGRRPKAEFGIPHAITLMVGRSIDQLYPPRRTQPQPRALFSVEDLTAAGAINGVTFDLHAGEVLGLFGLMGSGRTELARILFGLDMKDSGDVVINGLRLTDLSPRTCIRNGIAFVTENRREEGLLMAASIAENIALAALPKFAVTPIEFIEIERLQKAAGELADVLAIKASSLRQPAKRLSGGNQQKVVIAKWLMAKPDIFIMDEPTRGVDVGAKYEIYSIIDRLTADACGVLFISSELEELLAVCDRILVMSRGEIVDRFARSEFDRERVLAAAFREQEAAP
jgi:ABC-type sugar transport system ATPase subunit